MKPKQHFDGVMLRGPNGTTSLVSIAARSRNHGRGAELRALHEKHGGKCYYCGTTTTLTGCKRRANWKAATKDHVVPRCRGGTRKRDNVVLACFRCNNEKADLTEAEFRALLFARRLEGR